MACGDRYSHLLRAGGKTADDPLGMWCSEPDAELWYGQARHVFGLVRSAWNALMRVENEKGEHPHTDAIRTGMEAYESQFDELPEPSIFMAFGAWDCAEAVQQYTGNLRVGACLLRAHLSHSHVRPGCTSG